MNYSKKSTSRKQKALKSNKARMGKKVGVVFLKTLLVLMIEVGVAGLCGGIGIVRFAAFVFRSVRMTGLLCSVCQARQTTMCGASPSRKTLSHWRARASSRRRPE